MYDLFFVLFFRLRFGLSGVHEQAFSVGLTVFINALAPDSEKV